MRSIARFAVLMVVALASDAAAQSPTAVSPPIQSVLDQPAAALNAFGLDFAALRQFYENRNFRPVWSGDQRGEQNAATALAVLDQAGADGLNPADYHLDAIRARQRTASLRPEFDVLMTAGMLSYMHDLHVGRVPPAQTDIDIAMPAMDFDAAATLSETLSRGTLQDLPSKLAPPHREYADLKTALARYRAIEDNGGWPSVGGKATGKLTADDPRLGTLRERLSAEDIALATAPAGAAVEDLTAAIKRFQVRSGLEQTGGLGPRTLTALNIPVRDRIGQIIANMERWRWLPQSFENTYIEVNAASAMLKVVNRGRAVLVSRIIAGKPETPTPIFTATVTALTINPYWNIPDSIAKNEILPRERRNPGYMASQKIGFDGPGGSLRQQPGPNNALGRVKLEMPNKFDAYLHDTPSRTLFARDDRHLSHGCMRVEQILPLASWAMTGDTGAALDRIKAAIATGKNQKIQLDSPLPVYVLYWTAMADHDGLAAFRPDIYGRDKKLLAALGMQPQIGRTALNTNCRAATAG